MVTVGKWSNQTMQTRWSTDLDVSKVNKMKTYSKLGPTLKLDLISLHEKIHSGTTKKHG